MKLKTMILLSVVVVISACYGGDNSIGLSSDRMDFDAEGGIKHISYNCIMGIDYGSEIKDGISVGNTALIDDDENNDIFFLQDEWVTAEFYRDTKTVRVTVFPNDNDFPREYAIAVWCADERGYITICQQGKPRPLQ